jgi:hypothetical protein
MDPHGVNRVILATDGDFNVGVTNNEELKGFVERERNRAYSCPSSALAWAIIMTR